MIEYFSQRPYLILIMAAVIALTVFVCVKAGKASAARSRENEAIMNKLKEEVFGKGISAKLAGLAVRRRLRGLRKFFDPREYGGAPFLGLAKPVIKAHGSSDANAVKNAIRQASAYAETGVIDEIAKHAESFSAAIQTAEKKQTGENA